nr:recombinase family protein [Corynebacterium coyleae]
MQRQRELIEQWAETNGHTITAWAEDVDVSGSISPFDSPELGPFLTDEHKDEWDILVAWKLDRLARSSITLHELFGWIQLNDKQLVCISDNIDLSTWVGRMVAGVIAGVAEGELEAITERVTAGQKALREAGRFRGGTPPFGYRQERKGAETVLVKDDKTQPTLLRMLDRAVEGASFLEIANELNDDGIKTRWGKRWTATAVNNVVTNQANLGWTTHSGRVVLDKQGQPVMRCEPSISLEDYNRILEHKKSRSFTRTSPEHNSPLLGIIECWECGSNMHFRRGNNGPGGDAYRCPECKPSRFVNAGVVEPLVEELFHEELADIPVMEKAVGTISDTELEEAQRSYQDIASFLSTAPDEQTRNTLFEQLRLVGERISRLEVQKKTPEAERWVNTGQTYGGLWETLDQEGRRRMMLGAGVRLRVRIIERGTRWSKPVLETEFVVPSDLRSRIL